MLACSLVIAVLCGAVLRLYYDRKNLLDTVADFSSRGPGPGSLMQLSEDLRVWLVAFSLVGEARWTESPEHLRGVAAQLELYARARLESQVSLVVHGQGTGMPEHLLHQLRGLFGLPALRALIRAHQRLLDHVRSGRGGTFQLEEGAVH